MKGIPPLAGVIALALIALLLPVSAPLVLADATAPVVTFLEPASGSIATQASGNVVISWIEDDGAGGGIDPTTRSVSRQVTTAWPDGGCDDTGWASDGTVSSDPSPLVESDLVSGHCYRWVVIVADISGAWGSGVSGTVVVLGGDTATSPPSGGGNLSSLYSVPTFTWPSTDLSEPAGSSPSIRWYESNPYFTAPRTLQRQRVPEDATKSCANEAWSNDGSAQVVSGSTAGPLEQGYCYRWVIPYIQADGSYASSVSSVVRTTAPTWRGTLDLYRSGAFVTQMDWTSCIGAASVFMINLIRGFDVTTTSFQQQVMAYARGHDRTTDPTGSDPYGWTDVVNYYTGAGYSIQSFGTYTAAVRAIVTRIAKTHHPVGIVVMNGRHAWVVNGFSATADPTKTSNFTVTAVYVSGPLYPIAHNNGYDMPPDTRLSVGAFANYFHPVQFVGWPWSNRWTTVMP